MSDLPALQFAVLLGSLRHRSFNRSIANTLDELAPENVQAYLLGSVGDLPHYNGDRQQAGMPDGVTELARAVGAADAVVIVTPEYNSSVPGVLKNALDWLSRFQPQPLAAKPVALITASPGLLGGIRAQHHLRDVLLALDCQVLNRPEVVVTRVAAKIDDVTCLLKDEDTRDMIAAQLATLTTLVRRQRLLV